MPEFKTACLICIIVCVLLWLAAPFIAINIATLDNQPSALQFITDDITYIGDLTDTMPFWAAVISMIGIIVSLVCTISRKNIATRVVSIITEIPLAVTFLNICSREKGDMEDVFRYTGFGFWGIFILLIVVIILSGNKKVYSR